MGAIQSIPFEPKYPNQNKDLTLYKILMPATNYIYKLLNAVCYTPNFVKSTIILFTCRQNMDNNWK